MMASTQRRASPILGGAVAVTIGLAAVACSGPGSSASPGSDPSPSIQVVSASPSTVVTARPVATPSSPPTQAGDPYTEAVVAALAREPMITHLEQTATAMRAGGTAKDAVVATLSGDVSGDDMSLHLTTSVAGRSSEQDIVVVGDSAYSRKDGGAWQKGPRASIAASIDNLIKAMRLTDNPADLRYIGVETVDGRPLHHATASRTIPYTPASGGTGQYDVFDIWFERDGTPVLARTAFSATDPAGTKATGTTEFRYSRFGGPIQIVAPSVAP